MPVMDSLPSLMTILMATQGVGQLIDLSNYKCLWNNFCYSLDEAVLESL